MDAITLYNKYADSITAIFDLIRAGKSNIPVIATRFLTEILPFLMKDVGQIEGLSGRQKKLLIDGALDLAIKTFFDKLNQEEAFKNSQLDDLLGEYLRKMVPSMVDLFIDIEKTNIVFNKKTSSFFKKIFCCCKSS